MNRYGFATDHFLAADGTRLAFHSMGSGPVVLLANGAGCTFQAWRRLTDRLRERHRIVSWDYRGTHGSDAPADPSRIHTEHSVDDLEALLDHLAIDRAALVGWSMGVQVGFELCRRRPETITAVAAVAGTAGRIFDSVRQRLHTRVANRAFMSGLRRFGRQVGVAGRTVTRTRHFLAVMKALGIVHRDLDDEVFYELCVDYAGLDFSRYARMLELLDEHDAWDVLPNVRVPCAVVVGDADFMTPVAAARRMRALLDDCELTVLPGCTHYIQFENPTGVATAVERVLDRVHTGGQATRSLSANPRR